ncbi:SPOR domain-containing protein [Pseudoteredinibacter isoporae]|uniref:Cell division protein FtsN n=1 Tax=Pseudoteredinibacter isoporae TaxID=570281 RepID=A0A7X0JPB0_9GAMM|nr:SPOR domain-containing protein [Pseudoteredinibacter isoporae]MBB6519808.1 cell division protein FtsN [Pseudoteredinibacter isoporae]NHO85388.1 carbamoyl-phosphate synthase small subunit [Pseudoteredinibacter isoporae]NIB26160.1 carbamoyl-phosphate synthase small subunit [Pseudoteredinibacter isoporae]
MSQDFAKKKRSTTARNSTRSSSNKGNKRRPSNSKKTQTRSASGWLWFLSGGLLGSLATFLIFLSGVIPIPQDKAPGKTQSRATQAAEEKPVPQPRFDFYELLKESEVVVEKSADAYDGGGPREQKNMEYLLQVGSFRSPNDADRLHAELALSGFDSQVEKVKVRNGSTWHRVLVGPYASRSKLANTRGKLISKGIETLVIEREAR